MPMVRNIHATVVHGRDQRAHAASNLPDNKEAIAKANEIIANSPFAVSLTKEAMWTALEIPAMQSAIDLENRQQIMTSLTNDAAEAMSAFVEKRPPKFTNS